MLFSNFQIFAHVSFEMQEVLQISILKELYHEIQMGCWWYGWIEPYLEMNLG
jgi:hypothetical protein